jgi:hypothetical protein
MDVGVWGSVNIEKKLFKKTLALGGSLNMRLDEKSTNVASYFPELYLEYKFLKLFSVQADYRIAFKRADFGGYTPKHRIGMNFKIQKKISPLKASIRLRYQYAWDARPRTHFFQPEPSHTLRAKIKISYDDWDVVSPFIGNEIFYDLGYHDLGKRFNGYRLSVGLGFDLPKRQSLKLTYIYNLEIGVPNPWREHVASIGYYYTMKSKKGKKNKKSKK